MKELEEALKNLPKPNIEVPEFKRDLRRSLELQMAAPATRSWSLALPIAVGSAVACALMLAIFIARPQLPAQMNSWLTGNPQPVQTTAEHQTPETYSHLPNSGSNDSYLNQLLAAGNASEDFDRQYIQSLYHQGETPQNVEVKSLKGERVFTVREFELSGGKQVVVWTELSEDGKPRRRTPQKRSAPTF